MHKAGGGETLEARQGERVAMFYSETCSHNFLFLYSTEELLTGDAEPQGSAQLFPVIMVRIRMGPLST